MGILLIDNINRWKKKDSGKQFGLLCDKAKTVIRRRRMRKK